jgi:hypothetical protein
MHNPENKYHNQVRSRNIPRIPIEAALAFLDQAWEREVIDALEQPEGRILSEVFDWTGEQLVSLRVELNDRLLDFLIQSNAAPPFDPDEEDASLA